MNTTRFGTQKLGIGTISPKMVESELEGDKVVDLDHHNLGEELPFSSSFNLPLLPLLSLGFLSSSLLEDELIFVTFGGGCWMEGKASPSTHVQSPK